MRTLWHGFAIALLTAATGALGVQAVPAPASPSIGAASRQSFPTTQGDSNQAGQAQDLNKRLAEAEAELAAISTPETLGAGAPPGTSEEDLLARRERLATLAGIYRMQRSREAELSDLKAHHDALSRGEVVWPPPLRGPPYPYVAVDQLRENARTVELAVQTQEAALTALQRESELAQQRWSGFDQRARQITETLENATAADQRASLNWQRDLAQLGARLFGALLAMIENEKKLTEAQHAYDLDRLSSVEAAITATAGKVRFPKEDLDQVLEEISATRKRLDAELETASLSNDEARDSLQAAEQALKVASPGERTDVSLQRAHDLANVQSENAELVVRALLIRRLALERKAEVWQHRWLLMNSTDPDALAQAQTFLGQTRAGSAAIRPFLEQRLDQVRDQISEHELLVAENPTPDETQHRQQLLEVYRERGEMIGEVLQDAKAYDHLLARWGEEVDDRVQERPLFDRVKDVLATSGTFLRQGWDFELLAVQSTIEVDGQTITGTRSITVGKVVRAIFILLIGYWLSQWLSHRVEAAVVKRFKMDASRARVARRWVETLGLAALVIFALAWVEIPLTVFAFLGGAVAIGAGFGMQTALKNLISGLMILFERPFRPGDLIEVGGIRGRVTEIGVRSSVVRDSQGIETLIPNSTLVEQNVTNWTYTNKRVRFSIKVGVAYGAPTRQVAEILAAVALKHPHVLEDPEPFAVFEDFGADALLFSLDYWMEVPRGVEARIVAGEIRHLIDEALEEAGIVVAFPQRDVHLDAREPLRVSIEDTRQVKTGERS